MIHRRDALTGLVGTALAIGGGPALARPGAGRFQSNNNYKLSASGCGDLLNLEAVIDVTEDIVCKPTNDQNGFNFQLNCYSNEPRSAWQQYIVGLLGTDLHGKFQNFRSVGPNVPMKSMAKPQFPLLSLPDLTLPAGYKISIALMNDGSHNVTGVDFLIEKPGHTLAHRQVILTDHGLGPGQLAPIVAFELVLVGPAGGHTAVLKSGGGTFAFTSAKPLEAAPTLPDCVAHKNGTAEKANSVYGPLPASPGKSFSQTFSVSN